MAVSLIIRIPSLPPAEYAANKSRGAAWQVQQRASHGKRGAFEQVVALVKEQGWNQVPLKQARVKVTFGLPDKRKRDGCGLIERMKPWLDGLTAKVYKTHIGAGVIFDDDLESIGFPEFHWVFSRGEPFTEIQVWALEEEHGSAVD